MKKSVSLCFVVSLSALALPAVGQDAGGNVVAIHCVDSLPGGTSRLEAGFKKHMDWHRQQKDTWTWASWMVMTGPNSDRLCTGSFGHKWEDFDKPGVPPEADHADATLNIAPFAKSHQATFWSMLPEVSRPAPGGPAPMSSVIFYRVHFGMDEDFRSTIGEFHKAIEKTQMPWRYSWYALASGGEGGTYALVLPRANFAAFNPTGKPFNEMLGEAYGKMGADALMARWRGLVKSTESELLQARPDLGYAPSR
jgi:hypothetical protein